MNIFAVTAVASRDVCRNLSLHAAVLLWTQLVGHLVVLNDPGRRINIERLSTTLSETTRAIRSTVADMKMSLATFRSLDGRSSISFRRTEWAGLMAAGTAQITVTPAILQLAENARDLCCSQRLADGWTCSFEKNDPQRKQPSLVRFARLPYSEKIYDHAAAKEPLRAMFGLGYWIETSVQEPREVLLPDLPRRGLADATKGIHMPDGVERPYVFKPDIAHADGIEPGSAQLDVVSDVRE
jgi:hypothetical protein